MAIAFVQKKTATDNSSSQSVAVTLDATATSGNLLIAFLATDKDAGTVTEPAGFSTAVVIQASTSSTLAWAWKESDGTETDVQWDWTVSVDSHIVVHEYSGVDTSAVDISANANSGSSAVTSQSTGTTGTTAVADSIAFACFSADTYTNVDGGKAYSNSFVETDYMTETSSGHDSSLLAVATKTLSSTGTVECTYSTTDGGDQMCGAVIVFSETAGSGQTVSVGIASETDTALALTHSKLATIGIPSETDTASSLVISSSVEVGIAAETDTVLPITHSKLATLGIPLEIDTNLGLSWSKSLTLGISSEVDSVLPLTSSKTRQVGIASEVDSALSIRARKPVAISPAPDINASITFNLGDLNYVLIIKQSVPSDINRSVSIELNDMNFTVEL